MMPATASSYDMAWEATVELHFRLGIAVHRAECLLAVLTEVLHNMSPDGNLDLVDAALLGNTCPDARLSTLVVTAFGTTASAIALWHELAFDDPNVTTLLRNRVMATRFERLRSAACHGSSFATNDLSAMTKDFHAHFTWATDVTAAMRAPVRRFGETYFPRISTEL
jgi:hypothetical protein